MKEELLQKLIDYIEQSKDIMLEHAPDVLKQMIVYEKFEDIFGVCLFAFLTIALSLMSYFIFKKFKDSGFWIMGIWAVVSCFSLLCYNVCNLIKITVAPKYFMAQKFLGKNK